MSQLKEIDVLRKISFLSVLSHKHEEKRKSLPPSIWKEPKDDFHLVHITMFLLGFMSLMPMTFFSVANDYWLFKFRNSTMDSETSNGEDRTNLQQYFQSITIIVQTVPSAILSALTMTYSKYITERTIGSLISLAIVFAVFVIFAKINTDAWQTGFFILSMILLFINSVFLSAFQSSSLLLVAKLPQDYLMYYMIGQNGTVLTTLLQIVSLTVTTSSSTTGLMYFIAGTIFILITLILLVLMIRTEVFKYYVTETDDESDNATFSDMKELMKEIWPCQLLTCFLIFNICLISPSLTTLVEPQKGQNYDLWTSKYFIPVTVFLINDVFCIVGKLLTRKIVVTKSNQWWHISFTLIFTFIEIPFYFLCNAQPRTLPVIFHQDWQFIVMNILNALYSGYVINLSFMSLKTLSGGQENAAFSIINVTASVLGMVFCANGLIGVKLLNI
ncbi:unnamed protein product [Psylliodes chrysocephalus]|uniref:Equilibrative nucleoside transporter 3 n=1 Tax=Psylliodes chrysocephalus TaxID=3402493 RepID=A0A9P0DAX9_9CUCU|nr:unnamed protein product [Psylliodes chrysocephala]